MSRKSFTSLLIACSALTVVADHVRADDPILDWNEIATEIFVADTQYQNPGMTSRTLAMLNIGMYDAVNGIAPQYNPFYSHGIAPAGADTEAAAIASAYHVLSGIYGGDASIQSTLDTYRDNALATIPDSQAKTNGITYGTLVGNNVVANRANDGFDASSQYMPTGDVGKWGPDPLNPGQEAWGPAWGEMQPFAINSVDDFDIPAPPGLDTFEYAEAYNEVKSLGEKNSATRTQEQTDIGNWWAYDRSGMGTPMVLYNDIVRTVAEDQGNSMSQNAYMFAKTFVAVADAGIVAWDSKFEFDLWRPVTGIRRADEHNNPWIVSDPTWEPLGAPGDPDQGIDNFTPPFPTYLSGHATFGGALFKMLELYYGTDDIGFTATSAELTGPEATRSFASFSEAMAENGRSRVYLGIHWNYDDLEGQVAGMDVADFISGVSGYFQLVPEPTSATLAIMAMTGCLMRRRR